MQGEAASLSKHNLPICEACCQCKVARRLQEVTVPGQKNSVTNWLEQK